jgi:LmbE family N-acetylglucosaminyl deacetylase
MAKILVISTHPDDETLGMGGTLLKKRDGGDVLYWMIVTSAQGPFWDEKMIHLKEAEIEAVARAYRFQKTFRLGYPAASLNGNHRNDLITSMRNVMDEVKPEAVFLMFGRDIHTDHQLAFECAMVVTKPFRCPELKRIFCYETLSSTEMAPPLPGNSFVPNAYCDIRNYLEEKIRILGLYQSEAQQFPMPRCSESVRALARFRGGSVGVPYAESFMVLREML